jgi:hypothetical protein
MKPASNGVGFMPRALPGGRSSMPNREEVLREKTHKEEGLQVEKRVFYTLSDEKSFQLHRNTKAIALLVKLLHQRGQLSDQEIDDLLLDSIG